MYLYDIVGRHALRAASGGHFEADDDENAGDGGQTQVASWLATRPLTPRARDSGMRARARDFNPKKEGFVPRNLRVKRSGN